MRGDATERGREGKDTGGSEFHIPGLPQLIHHSCSVISHVTRFQHSVALSLTTKKKIIKIVHGNETRVFMK